LKNPFQSTGNTEASGDKISWDTQEIIVRTNSGSILLKTSFVWVILNVIRTDLERLNMATRRQSGGPHGRHPLRSSLSQMNSVIPKTSEHTKGLAKGKIKDSNSDVVKEKAPFTPDSSQQKDRFVATQQRPQVHVVRFYSQKLVDIWCCVFQVLVRENINKCCNYFRLKEDSISMNRRGSFRLGSKLRKFATRDDFVEILKYTLHVCSIKLNAWFEIFPFCVFLFLLN
jgi:hypothetical protein